MTFYSSSGFSEEQEQKILDAAKSLARLVRDSGAPVAFSIDKYAELVIGAATIEPIPQELEKLLKPSIESDGAAPEVFLTDKQMQILQAHTKSVGEHDLQIADFVEALDTALSRCDVIEICNCVLAEYGYDTEQFEEADGDDVFIVFPVNKEIKFLDL